MISATSLQDIDHLAKLIKGIRIAMMTTVAKDGSLCSRPMTTLEPDFDGGLWFFTRVDSVTTGEVEEEGQVNITYENSQESIYVSLSGRASLVIDPKQNEKLWHEDLKAWFPDGLNDPHLALLRIDIDKWACWDPGSPALTGRSGQLKDAPVESSPELRRPRAS